MTTSSPKSVRYIKSKFNFNLIYLTDLGDDVVITIYEIGLTRIYKDRLVFRGDSQLLYVKRK